MNYKKVITISAYDRPEYLDRTLDALGNCYGVQDYNIQCIIDFSAHTILIDDVCKNNKAKHNLKLDIAIHHNRVDCNINIYGCLDWGFQQTDYLIHIEDDIVLAKDALLYFEQCGKAYEKDEDILTVSAYNNGELAYKQTHTDEFKPPLSAVYKQNNFAPWGWATWQNRWEEIKENWQFGFDARYKDGEMILPPGCGWDVNMEKAILGDRKRICPACPRCKNIGRLQGRHMSPEHFDTWQTMECWSDDFEFDKDIQFVEMVEV